MDCSQKAMGMTLSLLCRSLVHASDVVYKTVPVTYTHGWYNIITWVILRQLPLWWALQGHLLFQWLCSHQPAWNRWVPVLKAWKHWRMRTVAWKLIRALACKVSMPISLVIGAQLIRTRGNDVLPSTCLSSYESTTYRGEFSGSSVEQARVVRKMLRPYINVQLCYTYLRPILQYWYYRIALPLPWQGPLYWSW